MKTVLIENNFVNEFIGNVSIQEDFIQIYKYDDILFMLSSCFISTLKLELGIKGIET